MTVPDEIGDPIYLWVVKNKWKIIIAVTAIVMAYGSILLLGKDNIIEIEAEKILEVETGIHVDLTP
jgi:hypothetical protein